MSNQKKVVRAWEAKNCLRGDASKERGNRGVSLGVCVCQL